MLYCGFSGPPSSPSPSCLYWSIKNWGTCRSFGRKKDNDMVVVVVWLCHYFSWACCCCCCRRRWWMVSGNDSSMISTQWTPCHSGQRHNVCRTHPLVPSLQIFPIFRAPAGAGAGAALTTCRGLDRREATTTKSLSNPRLTRPYEAYFLSSTAPPPSTLSPRILSDSHPTLISLSRLMSHMRHLT